jgi:hypothetical protein
VIRVDPQAGVTVESYRGLGKRPFDLFKTTDRQRARNP